MDLSLTSPSLSYRVVHYSPCQLVKQRIILLVVQVFFWLITLLGMILIAQDHSTPLSIAHISLVGLMIINFYSYARLAHQSLERGLTRPIFLVVMGLSLLIGLFTLLLMANLFPGTPGVIWVLSTLVLTGYGSLSGLLVGGLRFLFSQRQIQQQLAKEKIALELQLIRSQLNPHFLFNVLNNIDHFVRKDPLKASESIIKLSSLLRYLLYETARPTVPLEGEVSFLEEYIALQKQRLQETNTCTFRQAIRAPGLRVVPALFLPFLENAFSHCPLNQPGNFVYFDLVGTANTITFVSRNSRQITPVAERDGLGLALARKRLALLYPNAHELHILETDYHFSVELILSLP